MSDEMPIVTANFAPLRLVLRGEEDHWNPTLEEINSRKYDYVKLHRISTFLDVGIRPYSMGVCFDGTLFLPATKSYLEIPTALSLFNQTLAELLVGGLYCEAVTPNDIGIGQMLKTGYCRIVGGASGQSGVFHRAARHTSIGDLDVISLLSPDRVTTAAIWAALSNGKKLLGTLGNIPPEQLLYGTTFFVRKQWAESLIHLWTVIERTIEIAWKKHIVGDTTSRRRRDFLADHRTWPISSKLEVLFQKNLLPSDTRDLLNEVRTARNDFAHEGTIPDYDTATKALQACCQLASLCASGFTDHDLFKAVTELVVKRCNPSLLRDRNEKFEPTHWLEMLPIPGDSNWGDRPYEIVEEHVLKPISEL